MLNDSTRLLTESAFEESFTLHHQTNCSTQNFKTMETTINKVEIQGFLGRDAEERTFESGRTLITLNVATNESYKNAKGEWITNTTWHNVTHWRTKKDEALMESLKKGALVSVVGKLNTRKYTDKQGQDRYITEVIAQKVEMATIEA